MFRIIKEIKMGKSLYEYDLHTTEGLPYALYFSDISAYTGEKVPLHWHREFEITLVTKGRVKAFVDDVEMILEKDVIEKAAKALNEMLRLAEK